MTAKLMEFPKSTKAMKLASAPAPKRTCAFCQRELLAIELYCACPKFKLEWGLLQLKLSARQAAQAKR